MKVLILGAGAIGGYYGARLIEAGAQVSFLVRAGRLEALSRLGLVVNSELGRFQQKVAAQLDAGDAGPFDLVLLACKAFDLSSAMDAIAPAVDAGAHVLPLLNGLSVYEQLDQRFGRQRVLGGVAYIATSLNARGEIDHLGQLDRFIVGARHDSQRELAAAVHAALRAGPGIRENTDQIEQALWDKWATLAAGAAATCLMRANVGQIMATEYGAKVMTQAIDECAAVASASGYALSDETLQQTRARLLDPASTWAASMMRDIAINARRLEADAIVGDMARRAGQLHIPARLMEAAYSHLQAYRPVQEA